MARLLYRLGRFAYRYRARVTVVWVVLLFALATLTLTLGGRTVDQFSIPGTESQQALDDLHGDLPAAAGASLTVVLQAPPGTTLSDAPMTQAVRQVTETAAKLPGVVAAIDPFRSERIDRTGVTGLLTVQYAKSANDLTGEDRTSFEALAEIGGPLRVVPGGVSGGPPEIGPIDAIGVAVAAVVLLMTFGSLVAAGMTLFTALLGVGVGMCGLMLTTTFVEVSSSAPILALMLGLAVGIDYALFITSRHRAQVQAGFTVEESIARATATAGSAVLFAGATVVVALAGLSLVGVPFLTAMGLAAAGTVLTAVLVALTLLPAMLGFVGRQIVTRRSAHRSGRGRRAEDLGRPSDRPRSHRVETRRGERRASHRLYVSGFGFRWAYGVLRWRIPLLVAGVGALGVLAIPTMDLRLALPSNYSAPEGSAQRTAYDLTTAAFGEGANGPLLVVLRGERGDAVTALAGRVATVARKLPDVAAVSPGGATRSGTTSLLVITPHSGPTSQETADLVRELRATLPPLAVSGSTVRITGATAVGVDVSEKMSDALPEYLAVVIGLSFLLLLLAFRSVLVPLKATVGFLLTIGATFGIVVMVFQWGWGSELFGVDRAGPLVSFLPIIMLGVLFGLAMDYEVFIVSRVREEFVHNGDPAKAAMEGVGHGARVVTAAALIMSAVFGGFVLVEDPIIKTIGFGLSVGVLIDAFVVRMTLVPAALTLMGKVAWAFPGWLDRFTPHVDIEGTALDQPGPAPAVEQRELAGAAR